MKVLPVLKQLENEHILKAIAYAYDIKKTMTFYTMRNPFATTVTLTNGVLIEAIDTP